MGGHGGLNILPQKKWNVYRQDNRQKVEDDERLLSQARHEEEKKQAQSTLSQKVSQLKSSSTIVMTAESMARSDNDLYKRAKKELKGREIGDKKYIEQELVHSVQDDRQHVNLFRQEQISEFIKEKREAVTTLLPLDEGEFLKKTANLGDLMQKVHRPWYAKTVQPEDIGMGKAEKIVPKEYKSLDQFIVGQQISNFKSKQQEDNQTIEINSKDQNEGAFCQVLTLNPTSQLLSQSKKHSINSQSESESFSSEEDKKKNKKALKKANKERKRESKRQKKEMINQLRKERLQREEEDKKRIEALIRRNK